MSYADTIGGRPITVKSNQSAGRLLEVLEEIAENQPIGVSALARSLKADKSAVQRAIVTLAEKGWISAALGAPAKWELTAHIFTVAYKGHNKDWRQRARSVLEALRNSTGETALLTVPVANHFVVVDIVDSQQMLRTSSSIGTVAPARESATGRAILPYVSARRQIELLNGPLDKDLAAALEATRKVGYAVSAGIYAEGVTNIAAPVFSEDSHPRGAVVITGPTDRLGQDQYVRLGALVTAAARSLSSGGPPAL